MAAHVVRCVNPRCGREFTAHRSDARTCGNACRKAICIDSRKIDVLVVPIDLAERAWDAADGDGLRALAAAIEVVGRLEAEAVA